MKISLRILRKYMVVFKISNYNFDLILSPVFKGFFYLSILLENRFVNK